MIHCKFCGEPHNVDDETAETSTWQQWQCECCSKWNEKINEQTQGRKQIMVGINISHGNASVQEEDKDRAVAAALAVLGTRDAAEVYAEYLRQFSKMDNDPNGPIDIHSAMTGDAALWVAAANAADIALTEGWHNPAGAYCEIYA